MSSSSKNQKRLQAGQFDLDISRPLVMGIVNVTPDSFYDGGRFLKVKSAVDKAAQLVAEGADIIDIGGESSKPGALPVQYDEEKRRIMPVLKEIRQLNVPISVDTYKPKLMKEVLDQGASMINDIYSFTMPGALEALSESDAAICIMHMQKSPLSMQRKPKYNNVVDEVFSFLSVRAAAAEAVGISQNRILIDPGFGFGKSFSDNVDLFVNLEKLVGSMYPVLVGLSRKSFLGEMVNRRTTERDYASVAAALMAVEKGASVLRVHDVSATRDVINVHRGFSGKV